MSEAERRLEVLQSMSVLGLTQIQAAARAGVDVRTVRRWARRFEHEGLAGLVDRAPVPVRQPGRLAPEVERAIVAYARGHPTYGARKLRARWLLEQQGPVPSLSTFARVLARNDPFRADGVLAPTTRRRPRRFVRAKVNDLWQVDACEWVTGDGRVAVIVDLIDDYSRYIVGIAAYPGLSDEQATLLLDGCIRRHGAPRQLLSDNGMPFTGRPRRMVTGFERLAWQARIHTIHGAPAHPQTQGKIERFHATLKRELALAVPADLVELGRALERIVHDYNHHRPHQALDERTPASVWRGGWNLRANPDHYPDPATFQRHVTANGVVNWSGWKISIGRRYTGLVVTCTEDDGKLFIYHNEELLRAAVLADQPRDKTNQISPRTGHRY